MDFAALMSKEISKAKGDPKSSGSDKEKNNTPEPSKKYMRRGEEEAARVAAYKEEQERAQREREDRQAKKRKLEEEEADRKREREDKKRKLAEESKKRREEEEEAAERERRRKLGLPELPSKEDAERASENAEKDIEEEELIEKLRELDEPVRLFGENHRSRLRRYYRLVQRAASQQKMTDGPIPTTLEPVSGGQMIIPAKIPKEQEDRLFLLRQLGSYFNMVLSEWELALAKRDVTVRQSFQGKQAYNAMLQSRENMKPLFRRLEKSDLEDGLLEPIVEIVHKAQQRKYVDANDAYLRVSIGKAYVFYSLLIILSAFYSTLTCSQCLAHWCDHGWYSRAIRTREAPPKRSASTHSK